MKKPTLSKQVSEPKAATAPPITDKESDVGVSTSIPRDVTARGLHSECVVCQDAEVTAPSLYHCCIRWLGSVVSK